jgi:O-antigen/teichoic acid export membrane protein
VSLEAVGIYAVAAVLIDRIRYIVWAPLQVSWPRFALLDGQNNHKEVIQLFHRLTRFSNLLASGIVLLVMVSGPPFIRLWVGDSFDAAHPVLLILGIGCLAATSLYATNLLLGSTGHQAAQAVFASIEGVLGVTLSLLLGYKMGLAGVALGYTIAVSLIRGLICPWYVCYLLKLNVYQYYIQCLLRPWLIVGFLVALGHYSGILQYVDSWFSWIILTAVIGCVYSCAAFAFAMNRQEKKKLLSVIQQFIARIPIPAGIKG